MTSIQERMKKLAEAQRASTGSTPSNVPPPPVIVPMVKSTPIQRVIPIVQPVVKEPTQPPTTDQNSQLASNARRMFEEMERKKQQAQELPLKAVNSMTYDSKPPTSTAGQTQQENKAVTGQTITNPTVKQSVNAVSTPTETVGKLPTISIGGANLTEPTQKADGGINQTQPKKADPSQPSSGFTPVKPSDIKANSTLMNMFNTRLGGKPAQPVQPPPPAADTEADQRNKFIVDRLFSESTPTQERHVPPMVGQAISNVLHLQPHPLPDKVISTVTNILNPPDQITSPQTIQQIANTADQAIDRGAGVKKNRKKKTEAFDDM